MTFVVDLFYFLALVTVGPFYWLWRRFKKKTSLSAWRRLGAGLERRASAEPLVWIHAVSVGEVAALKGLIGALRELRPDVGVLITTTTTAGFEVARKTYPEHAVRESPLDWSFCIRRYFDAFLPSALVLVEAELWPNLLAVAGRRGVPVFVVNARVSDRSLGRYRLLTRFWRGFLDPVARFLLQGTDQVERLRSLGVGPDRLTVTGNIKFDNASVQDPAPVRVEVRRSAGIAVDAPTLVAGSTHPGEEGAVVEAFQAVRGEFAGAALVLAPRHLERLPDVLALLDGVGLKTLRWSERSPGKSAPCILVDTVGELGKIYAAGDVAFVGGSLSPIGGHNLLEPARFGIPMITGPHLRSVRTLATAFEQSQALTVVEDAAGLAMSLRAAFSDRVGAAERGRRAQATIAANQGAARRCAETLAHALGQSRTGTSTNHD